MILFILLIGHFLADFYFQTAKMAEKKNTEYKYLVWHSVIYLLTFAVICFLFLDFRYAVTAIAIFSISHFIIDLARVRLDGKFKDRTAVFASFVIDQILHIGIITAAYYCLGLRYNHTDLFSICEGCSGFEGAVLYILLFVVLINPTAIFIKKFFVFLFGNEEDSDSGISAGSIIGKLERVITAVLLLCNQYGVVGLVLTAKSIARFKRLEDKDFAEKYLIGTLTSLAVCLILTLAVKA